VDDDLITRDEIVHLLFNISDIAVSVIAIEHLLGGRADEEGDEG
jgi:hypothetical protein